MYIDYRQIDRCEFITDNRNSINTLLQEIFYVFQNYEYLFRLKEHFDGFLLKKRASSLKKYYLTQKFGNIERIYKIMECCIYLAF